MYTIAISLQKGGTGKTSLAVSLAAELAKSGDTVLIDADPQGNASAWIGAERIEAELAGVLFKKYPLRQAVKAAETRGLFLLPSAGLGGELKVFIERAAPAEPFCMQDIIADLAGQGRAGQGRATATRSLTYHRLLARLNVRLSPPQTKL